jgi:hypothetical protein
MKGTRNTQAARLNQFQESDLVKNIKLSCRKTFMKRTKNTKQTTIGRRRGGWFRGFVTTGGSVCPLFKDRDHRLNME